MRGLRLITAVCACLGVAEASAADTSFTVKCAPYGLTRVSVDGVQLPYDIIVPRNEAEFNNVAGPWPDPITQAVTAWGEGNCIVTILEDGYRFDMRGAYGNRACAVQITNRPEYQQCVLDVIEPGEFSYTDVISGLQTSLDTIGAKLEALTFLAQSLCLTCGLILGGFLWRTIIVAVRIK